MSKIIVIGGGAAGCVLAGRPCEKQSLDVHLLEAGPDYPEARPADLLDGTRNSYVKHDWGFKHRPTTTQVKFPLPRGRVVGGSSAVNTCIALRGEPSDYDEWGLPGFKFSECLPYFKKLENDLDYEALPTRKFHGNRGPLPVRRHTPEELTTWSKAYLQACKDYGFDMCEDFNAPGAGGYAPHAMNKVQNRRVSCASAYLDNKVRARENLKISGNALVHRLVIKNRKVMAVEVEQNGQLKTIEADVFVLAAGAIQSPGVLLRSGIGSSRDLARLGVEEKIRLEGVAARLLDHPGVAIFFRRKWGSGGDRNDPVIQVALRYSSNLTGIPNDMLLQPGSKGMFPYFNLPIYSIMASIGKPFGFGSIKFTSADPRAKPIVNSMLLENKDDRKMAVDAMRLAYSLSQQPSMARLGSLIYPSYQTISNKTRLEEKIRQICDSGYHPCGTAPMGKDNDELACCNERGHVRKTENLVLADASIMPTIPVANIHLTTIMIAEKISDYIKADFT